MASLNDANESAPKPVKLTYFHGWGLAEPARWMLAASGIDFEQVNLNAHAEFESLRSSGMLLFGQLPLLEIDGLQLVQSRAIVRYLARRASLVGDSPEEMVQVDMVAEAIADFRGPLVGYAFSTAHTPKATYVAEKVLPLFQKYLPRFEATLGSSVEEGGLLLKGGRLCYADVLLAETLLGYESLEPGFLAAYPKLNALRSHVTALPSLKAYLDSDRRFPFPSEGALADAYCANVRTVLGR